MSNEAATIAEELKNYRRRVSAAGRHSASAPPQFAAAELAEELKDFCREVSAAFGRYSGAAPARYKQGR